MKQTLHKSNSFYLAKQLEDLSPQSLWNLLRKRFLLSRFHTRDAGCSVAFMSLVVRVSGAGSGLLARGSHRSSIRIVLQHLDGALVKSSSSGALRLRVTTGADALGLCPGQSERGTTLKFLPWEISLSRGDSARPNALGSLRLAILPKVSKTFSQRLLAAAGVLCNTSPHVGDSRGLQTVHESLQRISTK